MTAASTLRSPLWLVLGLLLGLSSSGVLPGATVKKQDIRSLREVLATNMPPNIFLILADGIGYGDLGSYGQTQIRTPNLDRLAAEGTRYTQFYAGSPSSSAARCALLTGRHSGHGSIRGDEQHPLPPDELTLAKLVAQAHYQTTLLGVWGLGLAGTSGEPQRQGFAEVRGLLDLRLAGNYYPPLLHRDDMEWVVSENQAGKKALYLPDLLLRATTNVLKTGQWRPFLLIHSSNIPCTGDGGEVPSSGIYADQSWPAAEKRKAALISRLDRDIGIFISTLQRHRMQSNTLVLFTSVSGPSSQGGIKPEFHKSSGILRGGKGDLSEGGLRVPLIAWAPGKVPAGRVSDQIWAAWDLVPTIAELVRLPKPKGVDGISMARSLSGLNQTNHHDFLYWETHEPHTSQAMRMGDWKAIRPALDKPLQLFQLKTDPAEQNNVAASHPDVIATLEGLLKTARVDHPLWPTKPAVDNRAGTEPPSGSKATAQP